MRNLPKSLKELLPSKTLRKGRGTKYIMGTKSTAQEGYQHSPKLVQTISMIFWVNLEAFQGSQALGSAEIG